MTEEEERIAALVSRLPIRRAATELVAIREPALPALFGAMKNSSWKEEKWHAAAEIIGKIGDNSSIPLLLEEMRRQDEKSMAYWKNTDRENVARMEKALRGAVHALLGFGGAAKYDMLDFIRSSEEYSLWRPLGVRLIGKMGREAWTPEIVGYLEQKNHWPVLHLEATDAIARFGLLAVPALINEIGDDKKCEAIHHTLVKIGKRAVPKLLSGLKSIFNNDTERARIALALGAIRDRRAVKPLIGKLEGEWWGIRRNAAYALGEIGDISAVPHLMKILGNENENREVLAAAIIALGDLKDCSAVPSLIKVLGYPQDIKPVVLGVLGKIGDARAIAPVVDFMMMPEHGTDIARHCSSALVRMGAGEIAMDILLKKMSQQPSLRDEYVKLIGRTLDEMEKMNKTRASGSAPQMGDIDRLDLQSAVRLMRRRKAATADASLPQLKRQRFAAGVV